MFGLFQYPQSAPTSSSEAVKQVLPATGAVQGSSFIQPGVSADAPVPKTAGIGTPAIVFPAGPGAAPPPSRLLARLGSSRLGVYEDLGLRFDGGADDQHVPGH